MHRSIAITALIAYFVAEAAQGGFRVGNGGDQIRLAFAKAKEHAALLTLKVSGPAIPRGVDEDVKRWLLENKDALAADIAATPHEWSLDPWVTCAWTQTTSAAPINFSYPACQNALGNAANDPHLGRIGIGNMDQAGALLIHESVHHFGITDEAFADKVALAVYDAWRNGGLDWLPTPQSGAPEARILHSVVATGSEVIVFGGATEQSRTNVSNSGYKLDLEKNTWIPISSNGAPRRYSHVAVWTGSKMVIWGGYVLRDNSAVWQNSGAIYDPSSDTWRALTNPNGPAELADQVAGDEGPAQSIVWTGKELIVFGGKLVGGKLPGGIYDMERGTWRALAIPPQSLRLERVDHKAAWTGKEMIVWGGNDSSANRVPLNSGAKFDPSANRWTAISAVNAPTARFWHSAVWTGVEFIVFGGFDQQRPGPIGTGGMYDPAYDRWTPISTEGVLSRYHHIAVWTGAEMLVFGGKSRNNSAKLNSVGAFNPITKSWRVVEVGSAPARRDLHAGAWTGSSLVIFGGQVESSAGPSGTVSNTGGVFFP